jgi:sugar phosphate isomerase/epimerase
VKKRVSLCALLGAPHIRVIAGPVVKEMECPLPRCCHYRPEECAEFAGRHGIFLGLENHHGIVAEPEDLLDIVKAVNSPWFGINLDTGNFYTDDPYADLAKCAPYAVNVQVKMEIRRRAEKEKSRADLRRLIQILRDANYQGWVALEHEVREDPWATVPGYLAELRKLLA